MSVTETEESTDTSFQTPTGEEELAEQGELEEPVPEPDIGGSPELVGPVTRSGKKRKNFSAVRSTGKKKGKMIPKSPKQDAPSMSSGGRPGAGTTTGATARTPRTPASLQPQTSEKTPVQERDAERNPGSASHSNDLATLLANIQTNIQKSMTAMEAKLSGKMDSLETSVKANKDTIVLLTDSVNKNTVDLARLESQMQSADENFESKVTEIVRNMVGSDQAARLRLQLQHQEPHTRTGHQILEVQAFAPCVAN